jgi:PAS domain S-box-containing protein
MLNSQQILELQKELRSYKTQLRDIVSQHKRLTEELATNEKRYRELYNKANIALYRSNIKGKLLECNDMFAKLFGYASREDCIDTIENVANCYYIPETRKRSVDTLKQYGEITGWEVQAKKHDGKMFWMRLNASIYLKYGYIEGAVCDITVKKILTETEQTILQLIVAGFSNSEIADRLYKSVRTVEDQRAKLMRKLEVKNIVQLTKKAIQTGLFVD